jgi:hypothetical protein
MQYCSLIYIDLVLFNQVYECMYVRTYVSICALNVMNACLYNKFETAVLVYVIHEK